MYTDGKEVAVHADLKDEKQTEYFPSVHTTATSNDTEDHVVGANEKVTITDNVALKALKLGTEYTLSGILMDATTGEPIVIDGSTIIARRTFTADAHEMTIPLTYELNASQLAGTTTVVFEDLYSDGALLASHSDLKDAEQTVYIPEIHTTAKDQATKINHTEANKTATIVDTVSYEGLEVGREYTVKGVLMNKATGKAITVNGKEVTAESTFTAKAQKGTVDVTFKFDGSALEDTLIVVFETLYTEGKEVGVHADIEDDAQTVYLPKIRTNAKDAVTEIDHTEALPKAKIIDTVSYSSLLPGKEYTVTGTLMNKKTKEPVLIDGKKVTAGTTFVAEKVEGSVEVVFEFDASAIAGTTVVAFESMEYKGIEVAVHADIEDEDQTVYIPEIGTTALGQDTKDHIEKAKEDAVIVDTVEYKGLEVGREYTMTGKLVDKAAGEFITDAEGNEITASTTFTPDEKDGSVDVTFTFDSSLLAGKTLVAFETLTTEEKEVAIHADLEDEGQTIRIPEIHTTATDKVTGDHDGVVAKETTVLDEVFYKNLILGKEYTVKGTLMVKETGEALVVNGETVTAEKTFTAEEPDGSIILEFTFDSSALAGKKIVAF